MAEIGLSDAIAAVRTELAAAVKQGADAELQFPVDGVELEFQLAVTWEGETGRKARFWVLEWGMSGRGAREWAHTVQVTLGPPVNRAGEVVKVTRHSQEKP
jgi:Trypsin-co-occurring domain 2